MHPRWQRTIVPSLLDVVGRLSNEVNPQLHIATHSPLVLASAEPRFDATCDGLHHLVLRDRAVLLEELPFVKHGKVDRWLMSEIFGLEHARSLPAERALQDAKALQQEQAPDAASVKEVDRRLAMHLAVDDEFWPRWKAFASRHGVEP